MNSHIHWHVYLRVQLIGYHLIFTLFDYILSNLGGSVSKILISYLLFCIQLSYLVVDLIVWWGIRAFINEFRKRKLKLSPIAYFSTYHGSISHLPTGYMWSPHLVPKPSGMFCFLYD